MIDNDLFGVNNLERLLLLNNVDLVFVNNFLSCFWNFNDLLINYINVDNLLSVFNLLYWLFDDRFNFNCLSDWFIDCLIVGSNNNNWLVYWEVNVLLADINDSLGNINFINSLGVFNFLMELINDLLGDNNLVSCDWNRFNNIIDSDSGICDFDVLISSDNNDVLLD